MLIRLETKSARVKGKNQIIMEFSYKQFIKSFSYYQVFHSIRSDPGYSPPFTVVLSSYGTTACQQWSRNSMNTTVQSVVSPFTIISHFSSRAVTITRLKYGITNKESAFSPYLVIQTTFEPHSFTMNIHGSSALRMIRQFEVGIGNQETVSGN